MRYKAQVLAQHPDARLAVIDHYGVALRYMRVVAGPEPDAAILDIHVPVDSWGYKHTQGATAAWRSAYYCLVRQRRAAVAA